MIEEKSFVLFHVPVKCQTTHEVSSRDFPVPVSGQCSKKNFFEMMMLEKTPCKPRTRARTSANRDLRSGPVSNMARTMVWCAYSLGDWEAVQWRSLGKLGGAVTRRIKLEMHGDAVGSMNYSGKRNLENLSSKYMCNKTKYV